MLLFQFLILNQYLWQEYKYNDFFSIGTTLSVNVVLFFLLNIFNLDIIYLLSRTGLTKNFSFKSFQPLPIFHYTFHKFLYHP